MRFLPILAAVAFFILAQPTTAFVIGSDSIGEIGGYNIHCKADGAVVLCGICGSSPREGFLPVSGGGEEGVGVGVSLQPQDYPFGPYGPYTGAFVSDNCPW